MLTVLAIAVFVLAVAVVVLWGRTRRQQELIDEIYDRFNIPKGEQPKGSKPLCVALVLMSAAMAVAQSEQAAASLDRSHYAADQQWRFYYLSTASAKEGAERDELATATKLIVASTSRQPVLQHCVPIQVAPTLYRIDLADLQWDYAAWRDLLATYPYTENVGPDGKPFDGRIRADWLLIQLGDQTESDAYLRLLFGDPTVKTLDEALGRLKVENDPSLRFGLVEGDSGVSVQGVRLIENRPLPRGAVWITSDVLALDHERDPLEQVGVDKPRADGHEVIFWVRKIDLETGDQGALQGYFLADGAGKIIAKARVDLVADHTHFRGFDEIRSPGSCIQCHNNALNEFKRNELREYIKDGVDVFSYDYKTAEGVDAFYFANLDQEVRRWNEDVNGIVCVATGAKDAKEASLSFELATGTYDLPVDLDRAAYELDAKPNELKLALGFANAYGVKLSARLAGLAHGLTVPRKAYEEGYPQIRTIYQTWEAAQP